MTIMVNSIEQMCPVCGHHNHIDVPDNAPANQVIACSECGHALTTFERLQAQVAAEALGLGSGEARDDHVPRQDPDDPPTEV